MVLINVDLPRPDSPAKTISTGRGQGGKRRRTDDHGGKLEALSDTLPMDLVGKVGKSNVAHELFANDR
jgi:hypothetical protein